MIKVLADKVLAFDRGERTSTGVLIVEKTKIGFCSLADWVAETDYYKAAVADGSIKPISVDTAVADKERIAALEKELADAKAANSKKEEKAVDKKEKAAAEAKSKSTK